jgi:NAD(P)-dependent dehydrogenase (short-subunit alcohol dehydrogenase family)
MRSIVITGVSTGIGHATARILLARGFRVFGSVRNQADAQRLQGEFGANFVPLLFDVTGEAAVFAAADQVRAALNGETLAGLVNNAGVAVPGALLDLSVDDFRQQIEINVMGPVIVTKAFAPLLGADPALTGAPGRIVMMSSVSGQFGNPLLSLYSTSKFALEGLAESLRREFMLFGIDVLVIAPGAVRTPIWEKAEAIEMARFAASPFMPALQKLREMLLTLARTGLPPERIGELVYEALTVSVPKVRVVASPQPM